MSVLPEQDEEFLKTTGWTYTAVSVPHPNGGGNETQVVIKDYPLPAVYTPSKTDLLIRLPPNYPSTAPDMYWTTPWVTLARTGTNPNRADHPEPYGGVTWQRWSRHFDAARWRPLIDGLETYLRTIRTDLEKGV